LSDHPRFGTISFLSDYGLDDEFVGVVRSVIRSIAPQTTVVDITHGIPPHDVRAGALALARAIQYVDSGVILAVVDPGVGTARRAVAIQVAGGEGVFVGPDNGLLASAVAMTGGAERAVVLTRPEYHLPSPGPTFAGRDVFAPVAAHLAAGVPLDAVGEEIDPNLLLPGILPLNKREGDTIVCEVLWVDRYGNAQLNVDADDLAGFGDRVLLRTGDTVRATVRAATYGDLPPGQVGLVLDSYGLLSICVDRASAAQELGLQPGAEVVLEDGGDVRVSTEVTLGRRS
jgi:S-adenosyl-L-methionine hydrolase (adenosine-forming)